MPQGEPSLLEEPTCAAAPMRARAAPGNFPHRTAPRTATLRVAAGERRSPPPSRTPATLHRRLDCRRRSSTVIPVNELLKISNGVLITCCVVFPAILLTMAALYYFKTRNDDDEHP